MDENPTTLCFDVAATLWRGRRKYQEDAVEHRFSDLADFGYVILADGMGGHNAGDVASKLVVESVSERLQDDIETHDGFCMDIAGLLKSTVEQANTAVADAANAESGTEGMGSTLVTALLCANKLYWTSVGDSPLYLWRGNRLELLNEDHSLAPVIEQMVANGELTREQGLNHPDRHALTSAIFGERVSKVDLSAEGFPLRHGDVILVASDGLQYIEERGIETVLQASARRSSEEICDALIYALQSLDHPHQDNVSICVLRVASDEEAVKIVSQRVAANSTTRPVEAVQRGAGRTSGRGKKRWFSGFSEGPGLPFGLARNRTS